MSFLGSKNVTAYILELEKSEEARKQCERLMTVSISRFFRDRKLWEILQKEILPQIVERHRRRIKVWSAGCACGEEVYSLKIIWEVLTESIMRMPGLEITGTDMNPIYLERARAGIYPASSLKELPEGLRSVYLRLQPAKKSYFVKPSLKKSIIWKLNHLLDDPPGSSYELVFLRNNVLTYYQDELKRYALKKVSNCLALDGFLIIGSHENLPFESLDLVPLSSLPYVFEKKQKA
jgi:chemotaxis protein methyltransferase CheR